jgi:hypothetical protein
MLLVPVHRNRGILTSLLRASTAAFYTSITRSESVLYNDSVQLWESYKIQVLAKFGSSLLLNYKNMLKLNFFIATDKSGDLIKKSHDRMLWNCSLGARAHFHFRRFCSASGSKYAVGVFWKRYKLWIDLLVNFNPILCRP